VDPSTTDTERRRHPRRPASLTARLLRDDEELGRLSTRDLSLGGVYLRRGNGPAPPMGAEVAVELESEDGSGSRLVRARVVRVTDLGIALAFLDNEP
jgi:hypothetical protein